jgi:hypothetical protein
MYDSVSLKGVQPTYIYESEKFSVVYHEGIGWNGMEYLETIGGVVFSFPKTVKLYVYNNKKVYTLQEAFDAEIISVEDLQTIHYAYQNIADSIFEWYRIN